MEGSESREGGTNEGDSRRHQEKTKIKEPRRGRTRNGKEGSDAHHDADLGQVALTHGSRQATDKHALGHYESEADK